jgi:NAD(P)-dependent dehydrogenase (short-subunit alcohol dehydrogenase family)
MKSDLRIYKDAVAIITGGASGLGRAMAEELVRLGAEVVLADLQRELAEDVAAGIRAKGGRARAVQLDVTDFDAFTRVVQDTLTASGRIDYLFNNAGIVIAGEAHCYQIEDWNRVIDVNLRGVVNGVQAVYSVLRKQGFGHIVNTASFAGLVPLAGLMSYSMTKHAVVGLSTSLRIEAACAGVRVSVLCPGAVDTPISGGGKFGKMLQPIPEELQRKLWEQAKPIPAETFARTAMAGVARNKAIIVTPWRWRVLWWLYRWFPSLAVSLMRRQYRSNREQIEKYYAS